jgi:hypothetical protein
MRQPPPLAQILLSRLGPRDQSLVGDLYEEYGAGRSRAWLWRQVMASVAYGAVADIRCAPIRTSFAVASGGPLRLRFFYSAIESLTAWRGSSGSGTATLLMSMTSGGLSISAHWS